MADSTPTLRLLLATIAYRAQAVLGDAPPAFADFEPGHGIRSPRALLRHCTQVLRLALSCYEAGMDTGELDPVPWETEMARFHQALASLDAHLAANGSPRRFDESQLVHGPFSDVLTHVGQLALLRRLSGAPVRRLSYLRARVQIGQVGPDQPLPPA